MKAKINPPEPTPISLTIVFDSKEQYNVFKSLMLTSCICRAFEAMEQPALATFWEILPQVSDEPSRCSEIAAAIRKAV